MALGQPAPLKAHPVLRRSQPAAGAVLGSPPREIRLWFSESVESALSRFELVGADGTRVPLSPVGSPADSATVLSVTVQGPLRPATYTVLWKATGRDGHPLRGEFRFTVGGSAGVSERAESGTGIVSPTQPAPPSGQGQHPASTDAEFNASSPLFAAVRWLLYTSLLLVIGAVVFQSLVLRPGSRLGGPAGDDLVKASTLRVATLGLIGATGLLVAAALRLIAQSYAVHGAAGAFDPERVRVLLGQTVWGWGWLLQASGGMLAVVSFARTRTAPRTGWAGARGAALILAFTPALSGHAVSVERLRTLTVMADGLHVLGAGGWIGTLLCLVAAGLPSALRLDVSERGLAVANLVNAFSPVALATAGLLTLTGVFAAWVHVGTISALWESGYGRVLLVKLGIFSIVALTGAYNWRYVRPRLGNDVATSRLRRSATVELVVASLVIMVTAVLVATPTPMSLP